MKRIFLAVLSTICLLILLLGPQFKKVIIQNSDNLTVQREIPVLAFEKTKPNTFDVVFMGDSECNRSFSPVDAYNEFGFTSYVLAQDSQSMYELYFLFQKAIKQNPRLIVIEGNVLFNSSNRVNDDENTFKELLSQNPFFRFHSVWRCLIDHQKDKQKYYFGFKIWNNVVPYSGGDDIIDAQDKQPISKRNIEWFKAIHTLATKNNIPILLFSANALREHTANKHHCLEALAKEMNVPYLDLNTFEKEIGINWNKDTMDDASHLNIYGAKKSTTFLGRYLQDTYQLSKHTSDVFDEAISDYQQDVIAKTQ